MNKCLGCGTIIQNENPDLIGYSPKKDALYCERCFRVKNYSETKIVELEKDNKELIDVINKKANLVLFITDVLNITEEVIKTFNEINKEKILIINKVDSLPKGLRKESIINYLKECGINNRIIFASAIKKKGLLEIKNVIDNNSYVYFAGFTNSGKSSLINALKNEYGEEVVITTSIVPNTTMEFIKVKLGDNRVIDSPGFNYENSIYNDYDISLIKKTNMKNNINPVTYQIRENDSVIIEDMIRIDTNVKNSFTFYISNNLKIKKIYNGLLSDLPCKTYKLSANKDLIIKGLGFINIKHACDVTIHIKNLGLIEIRDSIIGK